MWRCSERCQVLPNGCVACCGDPSCLREHLATVHGQSFMSLCGMEGKSMHYSMYLEAIAHKEQKLMPMVGASIDRRTFGHVAADLSEEAVRSMVCMCCARVALSQNGTTGIALIRAETYFDSISPTSWENKWCFQMFKKRYMEEDKSPLHNDPGLADNNWTWKLRLSCSRYRGRLLLCCPEDVQCGQRHSVSDLCSRCRVPLCKDCFLMSRNVDDDKVAVPEALANDNWWGYVTDVLYRYKVRWIGAAAACPIFTSLICFMLKVIEGI